MRQVVSDELGRQFADDRASQQSSQPITSEEYQLQMEQFRQQLEKVKADASRLEQSLRVGDALPKDASQQAPSDPAELADSRKALEGVPAPLPQPPDVERRSDSELVLLRPASLIPGTSTLDRQAQTPDAADIAGLIAPPAGAKGSATAESRGSSSSPQTGPGGLAADAATRTNRIAELFLTKGQGGTGQSQMNSAGELPALQRIKETAGALEKPSGSAACADERGGRHELDAGPPGIAHGATALDLGEMDALEGADANRPAAGELKPSDTPTDDQCAQEHEVTHGRLAGEVRSLFEGGGAVPAAGPVLSCGRVILTRLALQSERSASAPRQEPRVVCRRRVRQQCHLPGESDRARSGPDPRETGPGQRDRRAGPVPAPHHRS